MAGPKAPDSKRIVNSKARFNYHILERMEVGIALLGTEVKSLRAGHASLDEAFARIERGEMFLYGCHIKPYEKGNQNNHEPLRPRKLLLHRREIHRLSARAGQMLEESIPSVLRGRRADLEKIEKTAADVDSLYAGIIEFVGKLSQEGLVTSQYRRLAACISVVNHVQNVTETVRVNLMELARERIERGITVSEVTREMLDPLREKAIEAFGAAMTAFAQRDAEGATRVLAMKDDVNRLATLAKAHLARRLTADLPNREWTFRVESDLVENLKRFYYFSKRIAKAVLDVEGPETQTARTPPAAA